MRIEDLAKSRANSLPNSSLVKYYETAIPQYHMESILTMEKEKKLTILQEFILKFVSAEIDDISQIRTFLGINTSAINNAIAILQRDGIITINIFNSKLRLTEKGQDTLKEAAMIVPENIEYALYVDGLTGQVYLDNTKKFSKKEVKIFGLVPIVPNIDTPTIEDLSFEEVKSAINLYKKRYAFEKDKLEGDLLEVSRIEKTYVEYNKVSVLVFMNNKNGDIELQVYEGTNRNQDYENILLQMYNNDTHIIKFDTKSVEDEIEEHPLCSLLPQEIIESAKEFSYKSTSLEKEVDSLTTQLREIKEQTETEEEISEESTKDKIRLLEEKIQEIETERKGADRILTTYEHRPLLIDALKNGNSCVVIISPWIKSNGLNNEILILIDKAVQRKTRVIIGYGISKKEDSDSWILDRLNEIKKKPYGKYLELIKLSNTHEKVLIKDDKFMVITSFNWLSFKGDPKRGFRQETGYYTESKECIESMKSNLSQKQRLGIKL